MDFNLTVKIIQDDYIEKGGNAKYVTYKMFQKQNIGFGQPQQDVCTICIELKEHRAIIAKDNTAYDNKACNICLKREKHEKCACVTHMLYCDLANGFVVHFDTFAADMQKVLIIPK